MTGDRINVILDLIGYQKKYACLVGTEADAIRHYFAVPKFEIDMDRIFAYWFERDIKSQENSGDVSGAGDFAGDFAGDYVATRHLHPDLHPDLIIKNPCNRFW